MLTTQVIYIAPAKPAQVKQPKEELKLIRQYGVEIIAIRGTGRLVERAKPCCGSSQGSSKCPYVIEQAGHLSIQLVNGSP